MFIRKSKIKDHIKKHREEERKKVHAEYLVIHEEIKQRYALQNLLDKKDYEIELDTLRQQLKYYKDREKSIRLQQDNLIRDRAAIAEASSKLSNFANMLGEIILKSGRECQGLFESVDRILKIDAVKQDEKQ